MHPKSSFNLGCSFRECLVIRFLGIWILQILRNIQNGCLEMYPKSPFNFVVLCFCLLQTLKNQVSPDIMGRRGWIKRYLVMSNSEFTSPDNPMVTKHSLKYFCSSNQPIKNLVFPDLGPVDIEYKICIKLPVLANIYNQPPIHFVSHATPRTRGKAF